MQYSIAYPYSQLFKIGIHRSQDWPDYISCYGFNETHIAGLIELATDAVLLRADVSSAAHWVPVHAWRTLSQLGAEEAIDPLLKTFSYMQFADHEQALEEIPRVIARFGRVSLRAVAIYLADGRNRTWPRILLTWTLSEMVKTYPETRRYCALIAATQLAAFARQDPEYNAFLIRELLKLNAVEHIAVINAAYRADKVDFSTCGDWQEVHLNLGLLTERLTPPPRFSWSYVSNESELHEWRQLWATAEEGEGVWERLLREEARREQLGNIN